MAISDMIRETKNTLEEIKRKYRFKKARMQHEDAVELQVTLSKCRGKLEICKNDFNRAINTQSRNINDGRKVGADTLIQEQILWDAAIGYMLVRDAIYALETISSYDAVSHAYEMLDAAMKQIAGKKHGLPGSVKGGSKERNAYGYITSSSALKDKEEQLNSFFEDLKLLGDIESRLASARNLGASHAELRHAYSNGNAPSRETQSDIDNLMDRLNDMPSAPSASADFEQGMDSMLDIHPPKG